MPALFTLLFKINIALLLFCLCYYAVLRHLTFYTLNRVYLVAAILFASVYPFININGFVQSHQKFTAPVQYIVMQWKAPAVNFVKPLDQPNYWQWAEVAFWTGVVLLAIRLIFQLLSLYKLYRDSKPGHVHNYPVRLVSGDVSPFSFWRSIYVNPSKLSPVDLEKVLEHEQVHVNEWHTLDILLAELSTVFYWFNPGIWLMKKAVRENIEFITDRKILLRGVDSKQYQYSLLNVSMAGNTNTLVNNFNISTIKKRIIMMNAKRSSRISLSRYMFVAPAVVLLLLAFSVSNAAIAKKGLRTIKSFASAIKNATISGDDRPIMHPALSSPVVAAAPAKRKASASMSDTIYYGKSKDGKRNMMVTSDKGLDSTGYVIDGAKSTRADLLALDPAKVYSVDLLSSEIAKKFVDFTLEKPQQLFVTTDNSERGMALKKRMDKDLYYGRLAGGANVAIAGTYNVAPPAQAAGVNATPQVYVSGDDAPETTPAPATATTVYGYSVNASGKGTSSGVNRSSAGTSTVYVTSSSNNDGKPIVISKDGLALPDGQVVVAPNMSTDMVVTTDANGVEHTNYIYRDKSYKLRKKGADNVPHVYALKAYDSGTTIDNFNKGVLYVIDGKETKTLKGVSAEDIASITSLNDEAARKKYGDKGQNGVIVITTKKGNK